MKVSDIDILRYIEGYCVDINNTINRLGRDQACFDNDVDYRNSICMSLLQAGEFRRIQEDRKRSRVLACN